uniref:Uncharacterized protein n=1 Tax=viral metagenome TaxID=1070528 RepID=A0A6C0JJK4_9ZZZZ
MPGLVFAGRRKKEPMRGGFKKSDEDITLWIILLIAAYIDFIHDFNDSTRALVNVTLLNNDPYGVVPPKIKFQGIEALTAGLRTPTAFHVFKQIIISVLASQMPADYRGLDAFKPVLAGDILHETDIMNMIKVEYTRLISNLPQVPNPLTQELPLPMYYGANPVPAPGDTFVTWGDKRIDYKVSSYPTKMRGESKAHVHTAEAFHGVTNQEHNVFVCMIDAASCSMDILGDPWKMTDKKTGADISHLMFMKQQYHGDKGYHFFILNSKENISDPAGKSTFRNRILPLRVDDEQRNVFIYFLEEADPDHVSVFPAGTQDVTDSVEMANQSVFSPFTVETRRTGTEFNPLVSAVARTARGTFTMNDVGVDSEVQSAVQRAVTQSLLGSPAEEVALNFTMKRFGDWCQALCLKDTSRKYKVVGINRGQGGNNPLLQEGAIVTLDDLRTRYRALVFLLTLDRVLLAFALAMGLNVIFTSKSGVKGTSWMTLFKNAADGIGVGDAQVLFAKFNDIRIFQKVQRQKSQIGEIVASIPKIEAPIVGYDFPKYSVALMLLRDTLSELSFLPSVSMLEEQETELSDTGSLLHQLTPFVTDNTVPITDQGREYQELINKLRTLVTTVEKNDPRVTAYHTKFMAAAAAVEAGAAPQYSPERMKEGQNLAQFFNVLETNPVSMSSRLPLFKSAEQTLRSIVSDAKTTKIPLTPLRKDISDIWDKNVIKQERPRQSVRAGNVDLPPMQELFRLYPAAAAAGGGQRGGAAMTLGDVFDAPFTKMVYVSGLPPGIMQLDDSRLQTLKEAAIQEAKTRLTGQLAPPGAIMTPELFSGNGGEALAAEIYSQLVGSGQYKGYISDGRGHYASVIDPFVFHEDDDLDAYLNDKELQTQPPREILYVLLRYMLWKTDELRMAINKLKGADTDNLIELDVYESIDTDVYTLQLLLSNEDARTFVSGVIQFTNGVREDKHNREKDAGQGPGITTLEDRLDDLDPSTNSGVILRYIAAEVPEALDRAAAAIDRATSAVIVANNIRTALKPSLSQPAAAAAAQASVAQAQSALGVDLSGQSPQALIAYFEGLYIETIKGILTGIQSPRPGGLGIYTLQEDIISFFKKEEFLRQVSQLEEELKEVRASIYSVYEKFGLFVFAYPQQGAAPAPGGRGRRKTHRRRLPKLV